MSRMSELAMEIEMAIVDGELTYHQIADKFNVPLAWVLQVAEDSLSEPEADPGDMDGDMASGLSSAGWGTDEDYCWENDYNDDY